MSDPTELTAVLRRLTELLSPEDRDSNDWSGYPPAELRSEIQSFWMTSRRAAPLTRPGGTA